LDIAIAGWIRDRGFHSFAMPKLDLFKFFQTSAYSVAKSWAGTFFKVPVLFTGYRDPFLYVFSTSHLPEELSKIFDEAIATFVVNSGGELVKETPLAFSTPIWVVSPLSYFDSLKIDYRLEVHLEPELERIEAATEEIHVPAGVNVTVKRSRTMKHGVEITRTETHSDEIEAGLKIASLELLKATIKTEVQTQSGRSWEETETVEYEVSLSGDKSLAYKLAWADLMRVGTVEIHQDGETTTLPFSCRERTEMDVIPVDTASLEAGGKGQPEGKGVVSTL
jgi:hypothetical protein